MSSAPTIIWVTIESTRADHTSLHGYERKTTPELDRIASLDDARAFDSCFAHGIWTLASSASILTGLHPSAHDVGMESEALDPAIETVPERLARAGYETVCCSTNMHLSSATDLERGFNQFDWLSPSTLVDVAGVRSLLRYLLTVRSNGGGFTLDKQKHGLGFLLTELAKRRVRSLAGREHPFFCYLHYGDPHHPYTPPRNRITQFLDDSVSATDALETALAHHDDLDELIANGLPLEDSEWETLQALYDAEIAFTDAQIGTLFDYARERVEELVFVVTADHGELFGEQGLLAHKIAVNDAVSHVPLVVYGNEALSEYDGDRLQHADVMETLLAETGVDTSGMHGIDLRDETRQYAITQRGARRYRKNIDVITDHNDAFDASGYHDGTVTLLRDESFAYLDSADGRSLYRLPDEDRSVSAEYPEKVATYDSALEDFLEEYGESIASEPGRDGEFSEEMKQQLVDLGYHE